MFTKSRCPHEEHVFSCLFVSDLIGSQIAPLFRLHEREQPPSGFKPSEPLNIDLLTINCLLIGHLWTLLTIWSENVRASLVAMTLFESC